MVAARTPLSFRDTEIFRSTSPLVPETNRVIVGFFPDAIQKLDIGRTLSFQPALQREVRLHSWSEVRLLGRYLHRRWAFPGRPRLAKRRA